MERIIKRFTLKEENQMGLDERLIEVASTFLEFIETGEKSLIENFTSEEIELTLSQVHSDEVQEIPYYRAMKKRVAELREIERYRRETQQKWEDRMIGLISGLIVALIIILLRKYLFSS
jgi:tetrahydromethanopterin S-methyltransferase subunit G